MAFDLGHDHPDTAVQGYMVTGGHGFIALAGSIQPRTGDDKALHRTLQGDNKPHGHSNLNARPPVIDMDINELLPRSPVNGVDVPGLDHHHVKRAGVGQGRHVERLVQRRTRQLSLRPSSRRHKEDKGDPSNHVF